MSCETIDEMENRFGFERSQRYFWAVEPKNNDQQIQSK